MFTMLYYPPNRNPELNNLTPEHLNSFTHSPGMWGGGEGEPLLHRVIKGSRCGGLC